MPTAVSRGCVRCSRHGLTQHDRGPGEDEQRQRMAEPPGQAVLDDIGDLAAARGNAGDRRDVVGFQRVLHAQQKTQSQNAEHLSPARLLAQPPAKSESEVHIGLRARATPIGRITPV